MRKDPLELQQEKKADLDKQIQRKVAETIRLTNEVNALRDQALKKMDDIKAAIIQATNEYIDFLNELEVIYTKTPKQ